MSTEKDDKNVSMEHLNLTVDRIMEKAWDAQDFLTECWRARHDIY